MKNLFKVLLASVLLAASTFSIAAANISYTINGTFTNDARLLTTGYYLIRGLTVYNSDAATGTISFYDAATTNLFYTNTATTNITISSVTTNVSVYTNFWGQLNTNSSLMITNATTVDPGSTNSWPIVLSVPVATASYVTWTPITPGRFLLNGLSYTNSITNGTIVIDYYKY